jgi:hypothetical protein
MLHPGANEMARTAVLGANMEPARTNLRRSRIPWWIVSLAAAVALGGVVAYQLIVPGPTPTAPPADAAPASPEAALASIPPPTPAIEDPVGPEGARQLLEGVSSNPRFRSWLAAPDLVRRWAVVTANVAEGTSPRRWLAPLAPRKPFSVVEVGDRVEIAPESYARYDGVADAIDSLNAWSLATAYRRLHGAIDAAYRALGYPEGSLDRATARALQRIEGAPVPAGEVRVERQDGFWVFASPEFERLGEVEKHLLRMGPRNERIVQAKARALREALGLPAVAAAAR